MSRYQHSKSGLFLLELLFNILLFCILCGCSLLFFIKAHNLSTDTTSLQHAIRINSSIAGIFQNSDGSFSTFLNEYPNAIIKNNDCYIYFNETYHHCNEADAFCFIVIEKINTTPQTIRIDFYNNKKNVIYSTTACMYTPYIANTVKEVPIP